MKYCPLADGLAACMEVSVVELIITIATVALVPRQF